MGSGRPARGSGDARHRMGAFLRVFATIGSQSVSGLVGAAGSAVSVP
jgi:hypothetical protein